VFIIIIFQGLGLLACSDFRTYFFLKRMNCWRVGRTPRTGDRPDTRSLPTQDNAA